MPANVTERRRSQQGVANGMGERIPIGVARGALIERDRNPAENQVASGHEAVNIISDAEAIASRLKGAGRWSSTTFSCFFRGLHSLAFHLVLFLLLRNVEPGKRKIRWFGDLDIPVRSHQYGHLNSHSFHQAGLISAVKSVVSRAGKRFLNNFVTKGLGSLGQHNAFA